MGHVKGAGEGLSPWVRSMALAAVILGSMVARADAVLKDADLVSVPAGPPAQAPPPRPVAPRKQPAEALVARDTVVRICYTHDPDIKRGCAAMVRTLRLCGLKVVYLENPTLDDIKNGLKGLPPNTNVSISSHGFVAPERIARNPKSRHHLATPDGVGFRPEDRGAKLMINRWELPELTVPMFGRAGSITIPARSLQGRTNMLPTKDLLKTIDEALAKGELYPSKYLGACHSGEACDGDARCTGASCAADQNSYMGQEYLEDQERVLGHLMCQPPVFRQADTDGNGVLEGSEILAYMKSRGLPRQRDDEGNATPQDPKLDGLVLYPTNPSTAAVHAAVAGGALSAQPELLFGKDTHKSDR